MEVRNRKLRIAAYATMLIAALCAAGIIKLRAYSDHVRRQGELLQSAATKLIPGVSRLDDVRSFVAHADRSGGGIMEPCDETSCTVSMSVSAFWDRHNLFIPPLQPLGLRTADYGVIVEVRDGLVRTVRTSVFFFAAKDKIYSAQVVSLQQFSRDDLSGSTVSKRWPGLAVCGGAQRSEPGAIDMDYEVVGVAGLKTTPAVGLNLPCVTSILGCSKVSDLFRVENDSQRDLITRAPVSACSRARLSWSEVWGPGEYPH